MDKTVYCNACVGIYDCNYPAKKDIEAIIDSQQAESSTDPIIELREFHKAINVALAFTSMTERGKLKTFEAMGNELKENKITIDRLTARIAKLEA